MPTTRCYNCGVPGHQTQACPRYGPRYPEPGKTHLDYAQQAQEIMNKVAADILAEHLGVGEQDEVHLEDTRTIRRRAARTKPPLDYIKAIRTVPCPVCDAVAGRACRSKTGKRVSDSHKDREEAYVEQGNRRTALEPRARMADLDAGGQGGGPQGRGAP